MSRSGGPAFTESRAVLLARLLAVEGEEWFALELARVAGLPTSTVYGALRAWTARGWLTFEWEPCVPAGQRRPRRKTFRFRPSGAARARSELDRYLASLRR